MFKNEGQLGQRSRKRGCFCTDTYQELDPGDCKMNLSMELKENQASQNEEENVAVIGEGKEIIKSKDTKNLKNASRIIIEDGVKEIEKSAFSGFDNLKEISLPGSIQRIGKFAFKDCKNLIKVESSLDLGVCDKEAFKGCQKLDLSGSFKFNIEDQHYDIGDDNFLFKGIGSLEIDDKRDVPLFGKDGPDESDIRQGAIGDCWLVGALASISHYRQDVIKNMIKDNEDGTADVTLQRELMPGIFRKEIYTVRKSVFGRRIVGINMKMMSESNETLWAQMVEKAYAAYLARGNESIDYNAIKGGGSGEKVAFRTLLGKESNKDYDSKPLKGDRKELFQKIKRALNSGTPLWYGMLKLTSGIKDTDGDKFCHHHAYSIMGAYKDNDKYYLRLRNPWGKNYSGLMTKSAYITVDLEELTNVPFKISNLGLKDDKPAEGAENSAPQDDEKNVAVIGQYREVVTETYTEGLSWANEIIIEDGVKMIDECAFINFNNLRKRPRPGSVEKIGSHIFNGCESLEEIELKEGIKEISEFVFGNIKKLKKITIPGSIKKIGEFAFSRCESLEEIELNDGIKEISKFAFNACKSLKRISIPGSVEKIGEYAFDDCENLEKVEIKNIAAQIDSNAFDGCKKLDLSSVFSVDDYHENIEDSRFYYKTGENGGESLRSNYKNDIPLFGKYGPDEEDVQQRQMGDCWLVAALASIAHYKPEVIKNMIKDNENGTVDVTLQRELQTGVFRKETYTVRKSVFENQSFESIMSKSENTIWVQMIEKAYSAYLGKGKESINFDNIRGSSVEGSEYKNPFKVILGKEASDGFYGVSLVSREKVFNKIKNSLNDGRPLWYAKYGEYTVSDIHGNQIVHKHAFSVINAYKKNSRYYMILRNPWGDNHGARSAYITVDLEEATKGEYMISNLGTNEANLQDSTNQDEVEDVVVMGQGREVITHGYAAGSLWASEVVIVDGVNEIGECAFIDFDSLKKITIPGSVKKIGQVAFGSCKNLEWVELRDGIREISLQAFESCKGLKKITIPSSVEKIGDSAFRACEALDEVELREGIREICCMAFSRCNALSKVTIPGSVKKIDKYVFRNCKNLEEVELSNGIEEIVYSAFEGCKSLRKVTIPGSMKKIGQFAFYDCENLEEVEIKNSATQIDMYAFFGCRKLDINKIYEHGFEGASADMNKHTYTVSGSKEVANTPLYINNLGVKENKQDNAENQNEEEKAAVIEKEIITKDDTKNLKDVSSIVIKNGAKEISNEAFKNLRNLRKISIPGSIERIGNFVFDGCDNLEEVKLKDGIKKIPNCAFEGLTKLRKINLPGSIESIGKFAFSKCESLEEIEIDNNTKEICDHAFDGCKGLRKIRLPENIHMEKDSFKGCINLTDVFFKKVEKAE